MTTPQRDWEYLISKVITLTALGMVESLSIVTLLFGAEVRWGPLFAGTLLLGAFYVLAGFVSVVRYDSLNEWLMPSVLWVTLLVLPAFGHLGLARHPVGYLLPTQPPFTLMAGGYSGLSAREVVYGTLGAACWLGLSFAAARRRFHRFVTRAAGG